MTLKGVRKGGTVPCNDSVPPATVGQGTHPAAWGAASLEKARAAKNQKWPRAWEWGREGQLNGGVTSTNLSEKPLSVLPGGTIQTQGPKPSLLQETFNRTLPNALVAALPNLIF